MLKDAGVVDAGGAGFLLLLDAALHVVDGEPLPQPPSATARRGRSGPRRQGAERGRGPARGGEAASVTEQRYEVMFLCNLADDDIGALKQGWGAIGDSIVVVGGDGVWNCHVHTNDIGAAIEAALDLGGRPLQDPRHRPVRRDRRRARQPRGGADRGDGRQPSMPAAMPSCRR